MADPLPTPIDDTPLRIETVTKAYGDFHAVNAVSFEVRPGEIFALLGPNGAGKSTLIKCIAGLTRQTSGSIRVFGHDTVHAFRDTRRLIGVVPQELNFDPFFTPRESLWIQMGLMGIKPDPARVDELLALMSLTEQRDAYTRTLSGGMKRRLLVAKALVHRPRLLFLDEPTAGVDVSLRKDLWQSVRALRANGTTVVLTTHYLEEAEELADRIGVIHRGELLLVEPTQALLRDYGESRLRVRFRDPPSTLPPSAGGWEVDDDRTFFVPYDGPADMQAAMSTSAEIGELLEIEIRRRRLEDIFVDIIERAESRRSAGGAR